MQEFNGLKNAVSIILEGHAEFRHSSEVCAVQDG